MRRKAFRVVLLLLCAFVSGARSLRAQDPPPRIPWFVVDAHATVPRFPSNDTALADSRDLEASELPGRGWGAQVGLHIYPLRWRVITFGVGGEVAVGRATKTPNVDTTVALRSAREVFRTIAPQLSFNFGNGNGWSYLSGGLGRSTWAIVPEGQENHPPDSEPLKTINYGGGARWFIKPRLAFSFDVRFYAINPGTPFGVLPGSPRTTLMVIGAGVSVK
jgi:hypothetical protein